MKHITTDRTVWFDRGKYDSTGTYVHTSEPVPGTELKPSGLESEVDIKIRIRILGSAVAPAIAPGEPCLHDACPECHGTGITSTGRPCVHMIACPCPKCSPRC